MIVELPVFKHNQHTEQMELVGVDCSFEEFDTFMITFYRIDWVSPYFDHGGEYAQISSGGDLFHSPLTPKQVNDKIHEAIRTNER